MKNIFLGLVFSFIFAAASTVSAQSVSGSINGGVAAKGGTSRGSVVLSIPGGLHANSNRPGSEYAIPTTVRITGTGVKVGGVTYPRGKNRKFNFSENSLNVYEGRVTFPFTVNVPANFRGTTVRLRATVHYQACTNEVCYPPTSKTANFTARIK